MRNISVSTIILLVLVHQILAGIGLTIAASRGLFLSSPITNSDEKTTSSSSSVNSSSNEATSAIRRCNSIRVHFSRYSLSNAWRNKIDDDDKRTVPTGPNPLHNR
ncbi:hypothetical protein ACH5RR_006292 [Cinchona calisaya]|uniref:Uncharacterized protein n=1 Tax=Cinchona calisaya TaxID=153742 RepID=A0ABD3ANL2_9GENT